MSDFEKDRNIALRIAQLVQAQGGRAYYVGGYVRDALRSTPNKDIDIEVHGLTPAALEAILDTLGERITIGESFGIYNLKGYCVDIAMPRKEKLRGRGHKDFQVTVDPFIGTEGAARRRDFTVNALMQDVLSGKVIDHFGGVADLEAGIIRHVNDDSFAEDPLRVLRAAQFAARFGFTLAPETIQLCRGMSLDFLAKERVEAELQKAMLKAERPSVFFDCLRQMGQLDTWFKEAAALIGVEQDPGRHAEGDVWTHTMLVLDEAAALKSRAAAPFGFMLAALTHDFGKAVCSENINGHIHAYEHESKGLPLAESFISRVCSRTKLMEYVLNLTALHMKPNVAAGAKSSVKATNRMFDAAIDPEALICLSVADSRGTHSAQPYVSNEEFLYQRLEIYREYMARPYVMGRDLIEAGLAPGADFAEILAYAHKLRLAGVEKDSALKQTLAQAKSLRRRAQESAAQPQTAENEQ